MASYREIVTKTVIGKGKKTFSNHYNLTPEQTPTTILGCWVINHNFKGYKNGDKIRKYRIVSVSEKANRKIPVGSYA